MKVDFSGEMLASLYFGVINNFRAKTQRRKACSCFIFLINLHKLNIAQRRRGAKLVAVLFVMEVVF
jgi:hypothetical protein